MSERKHSFGGLVGSGIGLLAIYAGVRVVRRAEESAGRAPAADAPSGIEGPSRRVTPAKAGASPRSVRSGGSRTYRQLYEEAQRKGVPGRSSMNKAALQSALSRSSSTTRKIV
jgi:hypothetical protein